MSTLKKRVIKKIKTQAKKKDKDLILYREYSYKLVKQLSQQNQFFIFGDTVIDIDQLLDDDHVKFISAHNNFRKALFVNRRRDLDMVETILDTNVNGITDLMPIIYILEQTQNLSLHHLAKVLLGYHNLINASKLISRQNNHRLLNTLDINSSSAKQFYVSDFEYGGEGQNDENQNEEWTYQMSLDKAYKSIQEMYNECQNTNYFFSYVIFQGKKYEQIKSIVATSQIIFRDFMCMSEEQIDYLLIRKPILFPTMMVNQFQQQTIKRINELTMQFHINNDHLDAFRQAKIQVSTVDFDIKTVDNLKVEFVCEGHLFVLSNYRYKKDDIIFFYKFKPKGNFKAQDIIKSQRNFKNENRTNVLFQNRNDCNNKESSSSNQNELFQPNYSNHIDMRYQAQSELFKERFYSMLDNEAFHEINQLL